MSDFLETELGSIAFCWKLERLDGVSIGFTTHDRDITIAGLRYRAAPGMVPSAIALSASFDSSMFDVEGALTSNAITAVDLRAGRWDEASVSVFMIDWMDPEGEQLSLARGTLGDVEVSGAGFAAALDGPTKALDRPAVEQTSPECRARLGDRRCRLDMASKVRITAIAAIVDHDVVDVMEASLAPNAYAYGRLRWITGSNSGLVSAIRSSSGVRLWLREPPPFAVQSGDLVELTDGCDKAFETCRDRFGNAFNFRGEPHLPGIDLLTRYGAG